MAVLPTMADNAVEGRTDIEFAREQTGMTQNDNRRPAANEPYQPPQEHASTVPPPHAIWPEPEHDPAGDFDVPDWARHAIWYQVFPDRFRNGDLANDPPRTRPWRSRWFTPSDWESKEPHGFYTAAYHRRYGGDLAGLEEKLPYLLDLGVNAIYLNPIFKAKSYHKYDATDYLHVDDWFGVQNSYAEVAGREDPLDPNTWGWTESDKRFLRFLQTAKAMGFRVILDGVFNHVGTRHPAFRDVLEKREKSRFADWFDVTSWDPFRYHGWWGQTGLPVFRKSEDNLASASLREYIHNVTRRWMDPDGDGNPRDGIDGWRLDVPGEVPLGFWREWRQVVKETNPDALIIGEVWERADAWLDGNHLDGVMNYEFAKTVAAWLFDRKNKITATEFDGRLRELRGAYSPGSTAVSQNLLDSHDTDRVTSMAMNPDRAYNTANRPQDEGVEYTDAKPNELAYARARLAAFLQMTYVGAPMVYYGDEVGMWGAADPTCRKPMLWEDLQPYDDAENDCVHREQLETYTQFIALRNTQPALRTGGFQTLLCHDGADVWCFERRLGDERLVVAMNAADVERRFSIRLPDDAPCEWTQLYGGRRTVTSREGWLDLTLPPIAGAILRGAETR